MSGDHVRFSRQRRLAEIGDRGQRALQAATASVVCDGFAGDVERLYLERAGVQCVAACADANIKVQASPASDAIVTRPVLHSHLTELELHHEAARSVAEGAMAALLVIRHVVFSNVTREPVGDGSEAPP
jgi:hypothetical protein